MTIKEDISSYLSYLKKYWLIIVLLYILIEAYIIFTIGNKYIFMTISSVFVSFFIICTLTLLNKDFTTTLLIYMFSMPILPMVSYLLLRLNILWLGNIITSIYFLVFIFNVLKEIKKKMLQ